MKHCEEGGKGDMIELSEHEGGQLLLSHLLLPHLVNLGDEPRGVIVAQHARVGQDFERPGVAIVPLHVAGHSGWDTVALSAVIPGQDLIPRHEFKLPRQIGRAHV